MIKVKYKRDVLQGIRDLIVKILDTRMDSEDNKLLACALWHFVQRVDIKLCSVKDSYQIKLQPFEAQALRMLYLDYLGDPSTYIGNHLHALSNQVHRQLHH